ncbi:unnamed protein product [Rotaria magnacalcarata]|uniref:Cc8L18.2-like protein n=2 Tax=Rotaria TaxID=231623 RepID=A0A816YX73_9BILA|nr:unnamed protein product [Rotaria magnacalcarata]CAF4864412.1 unnamed protein product [Rotaria socialis]
MDKLDLVNIQRYCCDPFGKHKKKITKDLRTISANLIKKYPSKKMTTAHRVCRHCQSELTKDPPSVPTEQAYAAESVHESSSDTESMIYLDDNIVLPEYELGKINTLLRNIDETPIKHSRISHSPHYAKKKIKKVGEQVKRKLALITQHPISSESCNEDPENEMIQQLIEKFNIVTSKSEKLTILTLLPKSWTRKNITEHFKCSDYMARQAKQLVRDSGVFSTPNPRLGKRLPNEVAEQVIQFYHSPEMSRVMPGLKDCISVKRSDGSREIKQKYLILCNLKEAYQSFKEKHPALKIGFSKFAELRPKECVLPGSSGTHSVCICTKHQNVKLMMAAIEKVFKYVNYQEHVQFPLSAESSMLHDTLQLDTSYICHYSHCLALLQCNPPQESCFLGKCTNCPEKKSFTDLLTAVFDRTGLDEIEFRQWISTDRSTLETLKMSADEFIENFSEKLLSLRHHDFIAKMQMAFLQQKKQELGVGEFLVIGDFAENYSFIVQDAVQSFHWNNCQATLHPFVVYYREDNDLKHKSFVAISDCNQHDTTAVHLFQERLMEFLKSFNHITKVFYFSDGCAAQYKNRKNFKNLCFHEEDFGVKAEWHFFATSHGKGPCDGIGGTVKRLAARASLQRVGSVEPILNPLALYRFAVEALPNIAFTFTTSEEHEAHRLKLELRFNDTRSIPGTQKVHCIRPISKEFVEVFAYSFATESRQERVTITQKSTNDIPLSSMKGYCVAVYDDHWYLACILEVMPETNELRLSFLHPHGPTRSFAYPSPPDELIIDASDMLMIVNPITMTGRTYSLKQCEQDMATSIIDNH